MKRCNEVWVSPLDEVVLVCLEELRHVQTLNRRSQGGNLGLSFRFLYSLYRSWVRSNQPFSWTDIPFSRYSAASGCKVLKAIP